MLGNAYVMLEVGGDEREREEIKADWMFLLEIWPNQKTMYLVCLRLL